MSLLPPNATEQEAALEATVERIGDVSVPVSDTWNPMTCPAAWLPWLAWAFSVDTWNADWPVSVKRQVVAAAYGVHQIKGTRGALDRALVALDFDNVLISEWWEVDPNGVPYTFSVEVELTTRGVTAGERESLLAAIEAAKNVRSHLASLDIWLANRSTTPLTAAASLIGEDITVYPWSLDEIVTQSPVPIMAAASYGAEVGTVYPKEAA